MYWQNGENVEPRDGQNKNVFGYGDKWIYYPNPHGFHLISENGIVDTDGGKSNAETGTTPFSKRKYSASK